MLHFPAYDRDVQRLNAVELDIFVGPDYLVTLPSVDLQPVSRLFSRCEEDELFREQLFSKGSGRLLYEVLDDLFDYCFPILDKIGHKLDSLEDDVFEGRSDEVVRDLSNAKQEIISYRKIIKPERSTLRLLERHVERFLPEELELYFDDIVDASERIWDLLDNYKEVVEALEDTNESVINHRQNDILRDPHGLLGDPASADPDQRHLRHERQVPGLRHLMGVLGDLRVHGGGAHQHALVLPLQTLVVSNHAGLRARRGHRDHTGTTPGTATGARLGALSRPRCRLVGRHHVRVHVQAIDAFECPIRSASSRAGIPEACQSEPRRWRRSCGE